MIQPNDKAKSILDTIAYAAIATVDSNGQTWNAPVAVFHFPDDYTLYWASWQGNQHSRNIRSNGKTFVVVYDSTPTNDEPSVGVYLQGQTYELTDEQEVLKAALVFGDDPYNPSDGKQYLGEYPRRIYTFVPEKIWTNSDGEVNGSFVDVRQEATSL